MLTRHLNELLLRLDQVSDRGFAEVRKSELLGWYGQERLTAKVWRDILEKWTEFEHGSALLVADAEGTWLFIWGEGLRTSEASWFRDIRTLAGLQAD